MRWYPKTKEDKKLRNKIEMVVMSCYAVGVFLSILTKLPIFVLLTLVSIPICMKLK